MKKYRIKIAEISLGNILIISILCTVCILVAIYRGRDVKTILIIFGVFIVLGILIYIDFIIRKAKSANNIITVSEYSIRHENNNNCVTEILWSNINEIKDMSEGIRIKDTQSKKNIDIDYDYQEFDKLIKYILQNVYGNKVYCLPFVFQRSLFATYSIPFLFFLPLMVILSFSIYKNDPSIGGLILFWIVITIPLFIFLIHDFLKSVKYIRVGKSNIEIMKGIDKHFVSYNNIKDIRFEIKHHDEIIQLELKLIARNGREINILPIGGNIFEIYSTIAYAKRNL